MTMHINLESDQSPAGLQSWAPAVDRNEVLLLRLGRVVAVKPGCQRYYWIPVDGYRRLPESSHLQDLGVGCQG